MTKVTHVKAARRAIPQIGVKVGDSYYHWKHRRGPKQVGKTYPKRSQLTTSEFLKAMYDAEDELEKAIDTFDHDQLSASDLAVSVTDAAMIVNEQKEACEESKGNIEDKFPNGCPTIDLLDQRIDACETIAAELEDAAAELNEQTYPDGDGGETEQQWRERLAEVVRNVTWDFE